MAKKGILYGRGFEKGRLRGLAWVGVLLCYSLLLTPFYVRAEMCAEIDFNKPTIAGGAAHTVGIKEDGTVVGAGANWWGQLNVSGWTNIKAVAAAWHHTVGLKEDGTVVAVGRIPLSVVSEWANIKAVAAGWRHVTGLKEDGTVVDTGYGGQIDVSGWTNIKAIAAGYAHTVGLKEDGTVVATGGYPVADWTDIKAIAAGDSHTVGLKSDGTVEAVGSNEYGQLNVSEWTNIKTIAATGGQTIGLKEDGTVVAVGANWDGQLNVSDWTNIKAIAAGSAHTLGLREDGTVVGVGANWYGQLNVSGLTNIRQPTCLNYAPIANAGPDQTMVCAGSSGTAVTLDASASSDPEGAPLTYTWTWDGGSAEGVNPTITLPSGTTEIILSVSDGKATATDTVNITVQDATPPITTATGGSDNWYNINVISAFSATDSCSGVKEIHYTVNGVETVIPGDYASLTLTADGIYNITYYSIDNAGNAESPNNMTVKIDKTPPVLNLSTNPNILWPPNHKIVDVLIGGNAIDVLSGIALVAFTVTDEYGIVQPSISDFNTTIQLDAWREGTDMDGRHYTITAVAADAAGNKTTTSATVLVPHDQGRK